MTTGQYRWIVFGQIATVCVMGLIAVFVVLGAVPDCRSRAFLREAIESYTKGSESDIRVADEALTQALAIDDRMRIALALRGRIDIERDKPELAREAYDRLEQVLLAHGLPTGPALNGRGCAIMLEGTRSGQDRIARLAEARDMFANAIAQDPMNGDIAVNAAICALNMDDLPRAAEFLEDARSTRNMTYESLVSYYSAVGSMLAMASSRGRAAAADVAKAFHDPDPDLAKTGPMLVRAVKEFDKALSLVRVERSRADILSNAAIGKAKLLAWEPLDREAVYRCETIIREVLQSTTNRLTLGQRQSLWLILAVSAARMRDTKNALRSVAEALRAGEPLSETRLYAGAALFLTAQSVPTPGERAQIEAEAQKHLLAALADPKLAEPFRFRAQVDLASAHYGAKDQAGALKFLKDAAGLLPGLEAKPGLLSAGERARFRRNFGILLYVNGEVGAAIDALTQSIEIDDTQKDLAPLLAAIRQEPVIGDIGALSGAELPPNMPIITATISNGGPVPLEKKEITIEVDGAAVVFTCGPQNRLYALPRTALAEGEHSVKVTVTQAGKKPVTAVKKIEVSYEPAPKGPDRKGG